MDVRIASDWKELLAEEFNSEYFATLTDFVRAEYGSRTIYPKGANIFRAFDKCPLENLKVVIIGQDPYHGEGQANGLCFSVGDGVQFPPSLINIFLINLIQLLNLVNIQEFMHFPVILFF